MRINPSPHWLKILIQYFNETNQIKNQKECEELLSTVYENTER